jgi:hypothetical protein
MRKEVGIYNKLARIYDRKTILPAWIIFDPPEGYMYTQWTCNMHGSRYTTVVLYVITTAGNVKIDF